MVCACLSVFSCLRAVGAYMLYGLCLMAVLRVHLCIDCVLIEPLADDVVNYYVICACV